MKLGGLTMGTVIGAHPSSSAKKPTTAWLEDQQTFAGSPAARLEPHTVGMIGAVPRLFVKDLPADRKGKSVKALYGYDILTDQLVPIRPRVITRTADGAIQGVEDRRPSESSSYPKWIDAPTGGSILVESAEQRALYPDWTESGIAITAATGRDDSEAEDADEYIARRKRELREREYR